MKLGYKILIVIAIVIGLYISFNSTSKDELAYTKRVNNLITDIRREDYFAIQNRLDSSIADSISIDDIKDYTKDLNLTRDAKFILDNIDRDDKIVSVKGVVLANKRELPLSVTYKDNNGTILIIKQKLGSRVLKSKEYSFPIKE